MLLRNQAVRKTLYYDIENLGAGVDIANRTIHRFQIRARVLAGRVIFIGATAGVAAGNELTVQLQRANAAVLLTTGALAADQAANAVNNMTLTAANAIFSAGQDLTLDVTQAGVADAGLMRVIWFYIEAF